MMTMKEALKRYQSCQSIRRPTIRKLMLWDETLSIKENGKKLGEQPFYLYRFAKLYKLKHAGAARGRSFKNLASKERSERRCAVMQEMKKQGYTHVEIANLFKLTHQRVGAILSKAIRIKAIMAKREQKEEGKNPNAVLLGMRGCRKGGHARRDALTPERRQEIARNAAQARWGQEERQIKKGE